jgi:hypothetical protein
LNNSIIFSRVFNKISSSTPSPAVLIRGGNTRLPEVAYSLLDFLGDFGAMEVVVDFEVVFDVVVVDFVVGVVVVVVVFVVGVVVVVAFEGVAVVVVDFEGVAVVVVDFVCVDVVFALEVFVVVAGFVLGVGETTWGCFKLFI